MSHFESTPALTKYHKLLVLELVNHLPLLFSPVTIHYRDQVVSLDLEEGRAADQWQVHELCQQRHLREVISREEDGCRSEQVPGMQAIVEHGLRAPLMLNMTRSTDLKRSKEF